MAWTAPRTWVASEVVTAAILNTHLKDNLAVLKTGRDATGRITDISSTTFASLSGLNITGLAVVASGNAFTGGRHRHQAASRVRVPVGTDKWEDLGGGQRRGCWVEGDYFHHIASNQTTEYRYLGELLGSPAGAMVGSVWIEGAYLHYIDSSGEERRCLSAGNASPHTDVQAIAGSVWVETFVHWIREAGQVEDPGHADVAHSDGTVHNDTHGDSHTDSHSDTGHADSHGDGHTDNHQDQAHVDDHEDVTHTDGGHEHQDAHIDIPHADDHGDDHSDSHTDAAHADTHTDTHSDNPHVDHNDHGDSVHLDQPTVV